jgi:hypothetical protein
LLEERWLDRLGRFASYGVGVYLNDICRWDIWTSVEDVDINNLRQHRNIDN